MSGHNHPDVDQSDRTVPKNLRQTGDADLDLEFAVHLPNEYAEAPGEPVYATIAKVPFKQSVNPSAREQAKLHAGMTPERIRTNDQ